MESAMLIISDLHIGASRKAGTTPASQAALTEHIHQHFEALINATDEDHIVINGDLFDGFEVPGTDLIRTFNVLDRWFMKARQAQHLTLIAGNHDYNPRGDKVSSFHLLAHFLKVRRGMAVDVIDHTRGFSRVADRVWAIPHVANQDLFDIELHRALDAAGEGDFLLLHANYDNNFAVEADHSLNVSREVAAELINRGWTLIFGHEHQVRVAESIVIPGAQIPTSVADCLGCKGKYYLTLSGKETQLREWLNLEEDRVFTRVDWRNLDTDPDYQFIRVEGTATAEEAAEVVDAVARFRAKSQAYVVTNAVRVEGVAAFDALAEMSLEQITAFNVLDALCETLTPEESAVVMELLK
jgi:DNA repair exonuclease SbcCD nuclease subunit